MTMIPIWWVMCIDCGHFECVKYGREPTMCSSCASINVKITYDPELAEDV